MTKPIPTRRLGSSGLIVSRLVLGTMMFGARTEEAEAQRIFDEAAEAGVNFIDTADTYAEGRSEQITGRWLAGRRDKFVLATKLGNRAGSGANERGLSRKWIVQEAEASLGRLGTDFVDILYLHKEDNDTRLEETVRALGDLQRAGKIRYFGVSNFRSWRIAKICELCDREGIDRPIVCQPVYHALNRLVEVEQLPVCAAYEMGVVVYSPTARGVLTGKYGLDTPPPEGSRAAMQNRRIMETEYQPESLAAAAAIADFARARGVEPAAFATAWVLANPLVTGAIAGPRTIEQWRSYRAAVDIDWAAADEAIVDAQVKAGTTAIPQFSDPSYPVEGRPSAFAPPPPPPRR
jgi:aryl-alcohol dehydrogenase-like predicted oxidoreductase